MLKRISLIAVAATVAVLAIVATAVATPAKSSAAAKAACRCCVLPIPNVTTYPYHTLCGPFPNPRVFLPDWSYK